LILKIQEGIKKNVAKQLVFQDERTAQRIGVQLMPVKDHCKTNSNPIPSASDMGLYWVFIGFERALKGFYVEEVSRRS